MAVDVSEELKSEGVTAWAIGAECVVGTYRLPAGKLAPERVMVEQLYCLGLSDTPSEVEVEGEGLASIGPDIVRFHNAGDLILSKTQSADACAENWVVLSAGLLEAILGDSGGKRATMDDRGHRPFPRSFVRAGLPDVARLRAFFHRAEQGACQVWIEEAVAALLPALLPMHGERTLPVRSLSARQQSLAKDADALLVRHYAGELSLAGLAATLGVTPPHLARSYRLAMGHPMHARLTSLRLAAAMRCLAEGAADITGLGLDLGYASHSHFTAAFRRWIGAPPSAFRAWCRADQNFDSAAWR